MSNKHKYTEIAADDVPAGVRFDTPAPDQGQIIEHSYGGFRRYEHGPGDPYMRITDHSVVVGYPTRVTYHKLVAS